VPTTVW